MLGTSSGYELIKIISLSLAVSATAVLLSAATALPLGAWLGLSRSWIRPVLMRVFYTLMGLPPTVAGLVVFMLLASQGPFGGLGLLFTPGAMVIVQWVLATPIITGLVAAAVEDRDRRFRETAAVLGATAWQARALVLREARPAVLAAVAAGLGRVLAEVGGVMLVGGNIRGQTRVMTTAILLETRKGNFGDALILGAVLLTMAFIMNSIVYRLRNGGG